LPTVSRRGVPAVGRLHGQHVWYASFLQASSELAVLSIEDVCDHRPERELHLYRALD
jgi:hypothetical protein